MEGGILSDKVREKAFKIAMREVANLAGVNLGPNTRLRLTFSQYFFEYCAEITGIDLTCEEWRKKAAEIFLEFLDENNIEIAVAAREKFEGIVNPYKKLSPQARFAEIFHSKRGGDSHD